MPKRKHDAIATQADFTAADFARWYASFGADQSGADGANLSFARQQVQHMHATLVNVEQIVDDTYEAWMRSRDSCRELFNRLASMVAEIPANRKAYTQSELQQLHASAEKGHKQAEDLFDEREKLRALIVWLESGMKKAGIDLKGKKRNESMACCAPAEIVSVMVEAMERLRSDDTEPAPKIQKRSGSSQRKRDTTTTDAAPSLSKHSKTFVANGVHYADVSAEVAARLQAKEDQKKAEKAEKSKKKRKRESNDGVQQTCIRNSNDDRNATTSDKPQKKKTRRHSAAGSRRNSGTSIT